MREIIKVGDLFSIMTHYDNGNPNNIYAELVNIHTLNPLKKHKEVTRITGEGNRNTDHYFTFKIVAKSNLDPYTIKDMSSALIDFMRKTYSVDVENNTITTNSSSNVYHVDIKSSIRNTNDKINKYKNYIEFIKKFDRRGRKLDILLNRN